MLQIIRKLLQDQIDNIDSGNSYLTEEEQLKTIKLLKSLRKDEGISKYKACQYLNMSRAKFDNLVREGSLPTGKKVIGFKELRWYKKDLDKYINKNKKHY